MSNRNSLLAVLSYLQKYSCEQHPKSTSDILDYLESEDIHIERHTIYRHIDTLRECGYDIEMGFEGKRKGYYFVNTVFDETELKILIDAVEASSFITEKKTRAITEKLIALTNIHEGKQLQRNITYTKQKSRNESILYNVDAINQAINHNMEITFLYFDYDIKRKKVYRKAGEYHTVPYALIWDQDRYYCVGYSRKYHDFTNYRVDKMERITTVETTEERVPFDLQKYTKDMFEMYAGQKVHATFCCTKSKYSVMADRFGHDLLVTANDDTTFTFAEDVTVSPVFFGWLLQMQQDVTLLAPEELVSQYKERLKLALNDTKC